MNLEITFENHLGDSISFGGDDPALNYFSNNLRSWLWAYTARNGRIVSFSRGLKELEIKVGIFAESEEDGLALRDRIYELADVDVAEKKPGRLSIGNETMSCYIIGGDIDNYWFSDKIAELSLTILSETPYWVEKALTKCWAEDRVSSTSEYLDYNYDYPFDYSCEIAVDHVVSNAITPSDFLLRIYGQTNCPSITIAGNTYEVDIAIPAQYRLEIDSLAKTIVLIDQFGNEENVYNARKLGRRGSGHYIFEKIPAGYQSIGWDHGFDFDLIVYEERSVPKWAA